MGLTDDTIGFQDFFFFPGELKEKKHPELQDMVRLRI